MSAIEIKDNFGEHDRKLNKAIENALRLIGGQAERYAKETISEMEAVDTGFLRNSITFAIDGEPANIASYQDDQEVQSGVYEGEASKEDDKNRSVYIGTNVYYAPYVEYGTQKMAARPFLSSSIQNNADSFKELFKKAFDAFF